MTKPADDLEAVRVIVEALDAFEPGDKERIVRWALEKLKITSVGAPQTQIASSAQQAAGPTPMAIPIGAPKDLRSFVAEKQPKSDVQFATTVAFYHRFEAPIDRRKENINADDLTEACRLANRERLRKPLMTLNNARNLGLLDSAGRGLFTINSVGENLVAMTLPAAPGKSAKTAPKRPKAKKRTTKAATKPRT